MKKPMSLTLEYRSIETLIPFARNPRTHAEAQIAKIAASILEYGWTNPILVDGANGIIAGHGRLAAARQLGLTDVPVIELAHLTPNQKRAYVIADNRLALDAGWNDELLALELAELSEAGYSLALTGFDEAEIEQLLSGEGVNENNDAQAQSDGSTEADDEVPAVPVVPVSRAGDLWCLGEHRLICGDAADARIVSTLMADEQAMLCFTSPPYANQRDYTQTTALDWEAMMTGVFAQLPMAQDGQVLVNLGLVHRDSEVVSYWDGWIRWMQSHGWRRFAWYVWDQGPGLPGDWNGRLAPAFEFIFHFNRHGSEVRRPNKIVPCIYAGRDTHLRGDGTSAGGMRNKDGSKTAWNHAGQLTQETKIPDAVLRLMRHKGTIGEGIDHPAVSPIALPEFLMQAYTTEGEIVVEPFCGSGTTLLAGQRCQRRVRAIEIAPEYVDVVVKRFQQNFPEVPITLAATGQSFEAVAAERQAKESA